MSLGNCLFAKSTASTARCWLAPPRDTLRLRLLSSSILPLLPTQPWTGFRKCYECPVQDRHRKICEYHKDSDGPQPTDGWAHAVEPPKALLEAPKNAVVTHEDPPAAKSSPSPIAEGAAPIRKISAITTPEHPRAAGLSESQYTRWKAAVKRSQIHKENKAKRRDELNAMTSRAVDWRDGLNMLNERTKIPYRRQNPVRLIRSDSQKRPVTQFRADNITRPSEWSVINFRNYVEDLAKSSVSPLRHRQLYKGEESHVSAVAEQLRQLFGNTRLYRYWSVEACNAALSFFYRHSMLTRARALYSQMEDRKYLTSVETFNIMLQGSASRKNLAHFQGLLDAMMKRKLKPNAQTWEAFFLVNTSSHIRYQIFQSMWDRGVLDDLHTMSKFFTLNIREVFCMQLDKGRTVTWFLEYMDNLNESNWLSTSTGNIIIHEVGKRGSAREAVNVLDELEPRGMKFDKVTLSTLLHRCRPDSNHDLSIHILHRFRKHKIYPDKVAYESIFRQFWRSHLYNCAKVAWRYACVEGQASSLMRNTVAQNITRESGGLPTEQPPSRSDVWAQVAGKVVVGVELGLQRNFPAHKPALIEGGIASFEESAEARTLAQALLDQDVASAHHYSIDESLPDLLERALAIDRQWAQEHAWRHKSLDWFVENSICVKLKHTYPARFLPPEKGDSRLYFAKVRTGK